MSGTPLHEFTAFAASQGPAWLDSAEAVINDVSQNTYTWTRLIKANAMEDMIQGGDEITNRVYLSGTSTFQRYNPNATFSYPTLQPGVNWTIPWAFGMFSVAWNKQIVGLNKNQFTKTARAQKYKDVLRQLHQNAWTMTCTDMEAELWALPNADLMESTSPSDARQPLSIPALINEFTNGLPTAACDASGTLWTTKQQIAPATYGAWVPNQQGYTYAKAAGGVLLPDTAALCAPLFLALSGAFMDTQFDRLPKTPEYAEKSTSPNFIGASKWGIQIMEHALRISQDRFFGMKAGNAGGGSDPAYPYPEFRGVPFDYISTLNTAAIFPTGASAAASTEDDTDGTDNSGPRFFGINAKYLRMFMHAENYLDPSEVMTPVEQPFSRVQVWDIWNNLGAQSLRRHFILYPTDDIATV